MIGTYHKKLQWVTYFVVLWVVIEANSLMKEGSYKEDTSLVSYMVEMDRDDELPEVSFLLQDMIIYF